MLNILTEVLTQEELQQIRALVAEAEFEDGKATAGYRAKLFKHNEQLKRGEKSAETLKQMVVDALFRHQGFRSVTFVRSVRPPLISRYKPGMEYGLHVDDPLMGGERRERTDIALTLFISEPADYDGGELYFESPWGAQKVKLPAGSAVVYPARTLHRVMPVTRGERLAAVTWAQSYVRDEQHRELLFELDRVRAFLHKQAPQAPETHLAFKCSANLLRLWAEP